MASKVDDLSLALYHIVAANGSLQSARQLLEAGASVNRYPSKKNNYTLLHLAAEFNNSPMVELILSYKPLMSAVTNDNYKETAIALAARRNHWDVVRIIAGKRRESSPATYQFGSALLYAIRANEYYVSKALLNAGAPTSWQTITDKMNVFHHAVEKNNPAMIYLLRCFTSNFSDPDAEGFTAIHRAIKLGYQGCINAFTGPIPKDMKARSVKLESESKSISNDNKLSPAPVRDQRRILSKKDLIFSALDHQARREIVTHYVLNRQYGRSLLFTTLLALSDDKLLSDQSFCDEQLNSKVGGWKFWSASGTENLRVFFKTALQQNLFQSIQEKYKINDIIITMLVGFSMTQQDAGDDHAKAKQLNSARARFKQTVCSVYVDCGMTKSEAEKLYQAKEDGAARIQCGIPYMNGSPHVVDADEKSDFSLDEKPNMNAISSQQRILQLIPSAAVDSDDSSSHARQNEAKEAAQDSRPDTLEYLEGAIKAVPAETLSPMPEEQDDSQPGLDISQPEGLIARCTVRQ